MDKREEIREVIDTYTDDTCLYLDKSCEDRSQNWYCNSSESAYKCLMHRLDELGVVIKVERELPKWFKFIWARNPCNNNQESIDARFAFDIEEAGLVAVEPLVLDGSILRGLEDANAGRVSRVNLKEL